jgi:hypothetical protein
MHKAGSCNPRLALSLPPSISNPTPQLHQKKQNKKHTKKKTQKKQNIFWDRPPVSTTPRSGEQSPVITTAFVVGSIGTDHATVSPVASNIFSRHGWPLSPACIGIGRKIKIGPNEIRILIHCQIIHSVAMRALAVTRNEHSSPKEHKNSILS